MFLNIFSEKWSFSFKEFSFKEFNGLYDDLKII